MRVRTDETHKRTRIGKYTGCQRECACMHAYHACRFSCLAGLCVRESMHPGMHSCMYTCVCARASFRHSCVVVCQEYAHTCYGTRRFSLTSLKKEYNDFCWCCSIRICSNTFTAAPRRQTHTLSLSSCLGCMIYLRYCYLSPDAW